MKGKIMTGRAEIKREREERGREGGNRHTEAEGVEIENVYNAYVHEYITLPYIRLHRMSIAVRYRLRMRTYIHE